MKERDLCKIAMSGGRDIGGCGDGGESARQSMDMDTACANFWTWLFTIDREYICSLFKVYFRQGRFKENPEFIWNYDRIFRRHI